MSTPAPSQPAAVPPAAPGSTSPSTPASTSSASSSSSMFSPELKKQLYQYSSSPWPAAAFSAALAAVPLIRPTLDQLTTTLKRRPIRVNPYPNNLSVAVFGGFVGLGSFLIYDHDVEDGSGLIFAWSTMYALANGRRSIHTLRLYPKFLMLFAIGNSAIYGGRFLNIF